MRRNWICLALAAVLLLTCCPAALASYTEMTFSDGVVEYVKQGEGFSPTPINDGTGWYIGYGCLVNPADYPNGISEQAADALLRENMQKSADYINVFFLKRYDLTVTQAQFDAMIAMNYALGPAWMNAANRLPGYIISGIGNYTDQQIASAIAAWCHVGGKVNTVALQRRIMEAKMFLYGDYTFRNYGSDLGWNWVILDANGGENDLSDVAVYKSGEPYGTLPAVSRSGWYFAGWQKPDGSILAPTDIVSGNLNLTARWSAVPVELPAPVEETVPPAEEAAPAEETVPPAEETAPVEDGAWSVFPDVPDAAWFAPYVTRLVSGGVVNGYEDGLFRPKNDVTWGEALKLILLASGFRAQNPVKAQNGAEPSHWASGYLSLAEKRGYLRTGSVSDMDRAITRNEMAELCAAALELTAAAPEDTFADSRRAAALRLFAAGILEGSFNEAGQRVFKGEDKLQRAEICAVLTRVQDYVARTWILFSGYRIPINYDLAFNMYSKSAFYKQNGRTFYSDGVTPVRYGIDVSWHQGAIDWAKVAAAGIDFAIIRCGYRGSATGNLNVDDRFEENIRGALENGIEVGVYFFSQALNEQEAKEELDFTLDLIRGWNVTMPVVFDWEQYGSRTQSPDWNKVTDCIVAFCDGVAEAGYIPMTYFNPSMAYLHLDLPRLQRFPKWLAHYVDVTDYCYDFQMWQYGSSGTVDGISGRVDMDILFTQFR